MLRGHLVLLITTQALTERETTLLVSTLRHRGNYRTVTGISERLRRDFCSAPKKGYSPGPSRE